MPPPQSHSMGRGNSPSAPRESWAEDRLCRAPRVPRREDQTGWPSSFPNTREPCSTDKRLQRLAGLGPKSLGLRLCTGQSVRVKHPLPTRTRTKPRPYLEVVQSHDVFMFQFLGRKPKFPVSRRAPRPQLPSCPVPAHLEDLDFLPQQRLGLGEVLLVNALDRDLQVVLLKTQRRCSSRVEPGTPLRPSPGQGSTQRDQAVTFPGG